MTGLARPRPRHPTRLHQTRHPRLNGKVERSHRIAAEEVYRLLDGFIIDDAQVFNERLSQWENYYNFDRPHGSLVGQCPYEHPTGTVSLRRAGKMHHIMVSRKHKRTPVILIIDDLDIRVVNKTTGELLRHLKLNPKNWLPTTQPKNMKNPRTEGSEVPMS